MKKFIWLLVLPLFLLGALGATYKAKEVNQSWKFADDTMLDQLDPVSGKWEIMTPKNLNQPLLSQTIKYADFPKALLKDHDYFDFEASTKIYVSSENADTQSGGLVLRYRNLYNFYMLFLNTKDKRVTLTRSGLSGLKVVKRVNLEFKPDQWYELKAICYLDRIKVLVDGEQIFEAQDETSTGGKVGLVTAGTSQVYFQELMIRSEDIEPVQQ